MTENEYLELPWSVEDTIENLEAIKEIMIEKVRAVNLDGKAKSDVEEIEFDFGRALSALREIQQYRAIGTVEECRDAMERQRAKRPSIITGKTEKDKLACCPICESNSDWTYDGFWRKGNPNYCSNCGCKFDWSDTD